MNKSRSRKSRTVILKKDIRAIVKSELKAEQELKAVQVASSTTITASTTVFPSYFMTGVAEGTDYNQRTGNHIRGRTLKVRVQLNNGAVQPYMLRCVALQCKGVTPTTLAFSTPFLNDSIQSFPDIREVPQAYKILYDKTKVCAIQTASQGLFIWELDIPVRNIDFSFVSTSAAVASAGANGVILFFGVDATTTGQVIAFQSKFEYVDM